MSEKNKKQNLPGSPRKVSGWLAAPFFVTLAVLTVVSFVIPLRPTVSYSEKRELARFPEFSMEALISGSYFDDITTWYSDTFPGREQWLEVAAGTKSLYGYSEISIEGSLAPVSDEIPVSMEVPEPETPGVEPEEETAVTDTVPEETAAEEETSGETEPEGWGGIDAGEDAEISLGTAIQIGDAAFNQLGFSKYESDRYIKTLNTFAEAVKDKGVRVISCPAPTAVGIMVEEQYLQKLNCASQREMVNYLHGGMTEDIVKVDTFSNIVKHNDEYIYFRTDHHWTARGAYYAYEALCQAAGMEPAPLDSFEEWDQGTLTGSLYGKVSKPHKLRKDNLYCYIPQGDITMVTYSENGIARGEQPILRDMSAEPDNATYSTFISGDYAMVEITNESIPDAPNCVVIKDSFGNPFSIYLTQNYHKVYCIDYRKYKAMGLQQYVEEYEISDVIYAPYLIATQSSLGNDFFRNRSR